MSMFNMSFTLPISTYKLELASRAKKRPKTLLPQTITYNVRDDSPLIDEDEVIHVGNFDGISHRTTTRVDFFQALIERELVHSRFMEHDAAYQHFLWTPGRDHVQCSRDNGATLGSVAFIGTQRTECGLTDSGILTLQELACLKRLDRDSKHALVYGRGSCGVMFVSYPHNWNTYLCVGEHTDLEATLIEGYSPTKASLMEKAIQEADTDEFDNDFWTKRSDAMVKSVPKWLLARTVAPHIGFNMVRGPPSGPEWIRCYPDHPLSDNWTKDDCYAYASASGLMPSGLMDTGWQQWDFDAGVDVMSGTVIDDHAFNYMLGMSRYTNRRSNGGRIRAQRSRMYHLRPMSLSKPVENIASAYSVLRDHIGNGYDRGYVNRFYAYDGRALHLVWAASRNHRLVIATPTRHERRGTYDRWEPHPPLRENVDGPFTAGNIRFTRGDVDDTQLPADWPYMRRDTRRGRRAMARMDARTSLWNGRTSPDVPDDTVIIYVTQIYNFSAQKSMADEVWMYATRRVLKSVLNVLPMCVLVEILSYISGIGALARASRAMSVRNGWVGVSGRVSSGYARLRPPSIYEYSRARRNLETFGFY